MKKLIEYIEYLFEGRKLPQITINVIDKTLECYQPINSLEYE